MGSVSKFDKRAFRVGTGQVYYGSPLKRLLEAQPPMSKRDKDAMFRWFLLLLMGVSIGFAYLIVSL